MENTHYNCTFSVPQSAAQVLQSVCDVKKWWTEHVEGETEKTGDTFTIRFGETWVNFRVTKIEPGKGVEWLVTDCNLHWLEDKKEWNDTRMQFDLSENGDGTTMSVTHLGLTPQLACYDNCKKGWDFYAGESLPKLITENTGKPDRRKAEHSA